MTGDGAHAAAEAAKAFLAALVRSAVTADPALAESRLAEAEAALPALRGAFAEGAPTESRWDGIWSAAVEAGESPDLRDEPTRVSLALPSTCPVRPSDIGETGVTVAELSDRIRRSAATG